MEVGFALGQGFEFFAVVEFAFVAGAVDHPDFFAFAAIDAGVGAGFRKEPLRESAHGGDAGAGGDKDGVGDGLLENEVAVGSVDLDGAAGRQVGEIGEVVGKESLGHAVDAKLEVVGVGCGGNGVGAGLLLAVGISGDGGDELAGDEGKGLEIVENEIEVVALGRFRD